MNFVADVVDAAPGDRLALIELRRDGSRRPWTCREVSDASARLAGRFRKLGVDRGDVVMTLIGNRPEWVLAMVACFRIGAVVLPCTEQLRRGDLRLRLEAARPHVVVADARNLAELEAARPDAIVLTVPDSDLFAADPVAHEDLDPEAPCLITFTSGTTGEPKGALHCQRYLAGQQLQASNWLGAREGDRVWCTAASGWSKSARNAFIAPWIQGATAVLHDARFEPQERLDLIERERINVLCMGPTEYRLVAKHAALKHYGDLRSLVAAGEPLDPHTFRTWREATGVEIRDGYGQTETGQLTGVPPDAPARPGSMGRPLPGVRMWVDEGELVVDPSTVPTFFAGYLGEDHSERGGPWRTGDHVTEDKDGFLYFEGRTDDVIISAGYRIGPFEVESALLSHPAVREAAVIAAPDQERGHVVRAVVTLVPGRAPSEDLASSLQDHVKVRTAPYKYPRIVEFADEIPKTASGKIHRGRLRAVSADE